MSLKFRHAGQACITSNRIYVQNGVYNKFAELLVERTKALKIGHGMDKGTTIGPLTTPAGLDKVENQIEDAKKQGATVLIGGQRLNQMEGYFFEPTIIKDAGPDMLVSKEETFGPLLAIFPFETEEEAVAAANNTSVSLFMYHVPPRVPILFILSSILTRYLIFHLADGFIIIFLHQERRSYMALVGELRGWNDWNEYG